MPSSVMLFSQRSAVVAGADDVAAVVAELGAVDESLVSRDHDAASVGEVPHVHPAVETSGEHARAIL